MDLPFEVVTLGPTDHIEPGETAPDFKRPLVTDEFWEDVALAELTASGPVLLLFHPMAGSFPATYTWKEVRQRGWIESDVRIVGVSIATPYAHKRLLADRAVDAQIYSDPGNEVAEAFGIAHDLDGMAGISEPRPAAFLLDADRTVTYAWVARKWPDFPPYDAVENALQRLAGDGAGVPEAESGDSGMREDETASAEEGT